MNVKREITVHTYDFESFKLNIKSTNGNTDNKAEAKKIYDFLAEALPSATFYALAKEFHAEWAM